MARRRIGQEAFGFAQGEVGRKAGLDELAAVIDWVAIERSLKDVCAAAEGEPAWPPLALFKALLLAVWRDLSGVRLAEALDDRASFRRCCGFAATEGTLERTALVFQRVLVARGLDAKLLRAVVRQLETKKLVVKTGTLVGATVIAVASKDDPEASWNVDGRGGPVKRYKAHVAPDEDGGAVVTPANVHNARGLAPVLPARPGRVWADAAYDHAAVRRISAPRAGRRISRCIVPRRSSGYLGWAKIIPTRLSRAASR